MKYHHPFVAVVSMLFLALASARDCTLEESADCVTFIESLGAVRGIGCSCVNRDVNVCDFNRDGTTSYNCGGGTYTLCRDMCANKLFRCAWVKLDNDETTEQCAMFEN